MSLVSLALQRVLSQQQNDDLRSSTGSAEHQAASTLKGTQEEAAEINEVIDLGKPIRCPSCGRVQETTGTGRWTKRFLRLMRIRPYRCNFCRQRFSRSSGVVPWSSTFLS